MDPHALIILAAINGGRMRKDHPRVPYTPAEVAAEARRCADAGAAIVHIHARHADGGWSYDPRWYEEALAAIRRETELLINVTTAREPDRPVEEVIRYLTGVPKPPDAICLNTGPIAVHRPGADGVRQTIVVPSSVSDMRSLVDACRNHGIIVKPAILDSGYLSVLIALVEDGVVPAPDQLLLEFWSAYGDGYQFMPASPRSYRYARDCIADLLPRCRVLAHGIDDTGFDIARLAIADGAHVRIGLEDRIAYEDRSPVESTAQLIEWVVAVGREHGRDPATPAQVRELLRA